MATTTTQAPSRNLVVSRTTPATAVSTAPTPFRTARRSQPCGRCPAQCLYETGLTDGEADEHADREERDHAVGVGVHGDQERGREQGEGYHAPAVHRPFRTQPEEVRQPVVLGEQAHQDGQTAELVFAAKARARVTMRLVA